MIARRAFVLAAAALLLGGCGLVQKTKHAVEKTRARPTGADFKRLRAEYTRQGQLYDGFIHRASATATYLSPALRDARARQLGEWLSWTPEELERQLASERDDAAKYDEFVVSFFAADFASNDLDAPRSIWRLAVELGDGTAVLPLQVRSVDSDSTITTLYPWVGKFDTVYVLRFPRAPGAPLAERPFVLMLAAAMGKIPLDFGAPGGPIRLPDQAP